MPRGVIWDLKPYHLVHTLRLRRCGFSWREVAALDRMGPSYRTLIRRVGYLDDVDKSTGRVLPLEKLVSGNANNLSKLGL